MTASYFVTGTDTEVGKTFVSAALLARAGQLGLRSAAFKPVAAGADATPAGLRNEDALTLMAAANLELSYRLVNPICLAPAIAPHIAASEAGVELSVAGLMDHARHFFAVPADFRLVEGAGGWKVPLNGSETLADFAVALGLPVILVVAMRLGCISHALLTAEAIASAGLPLAGWVANQGAGPRMARHGENLATLAALLPAPLLGELPQVAGGDWRLVATHLRLPEGLEPDGQRG